MASKLSWKVRGQDYADEFSDPHATPEDKLMTAAIYTVNTLTALLDFGDKFMATLQQVSDDLDAIKAAVGEVSTGIDDLLAKIVDLKAQVAAGTASQEQIDALEVKAQEIKAAVDAAHAKEVQ